VSEDEKAGAAEPRAAQAAAASESDVAASNARGAIWYVVAMLLLASFFAFGPILCGDGDEARIRREGVAAKARVTKIVPTGVYFNDQPRVRISLEVTPEGQEPFEAKVVQFMSPVDLPRYQPGAVLDVRFDPQGRRDVVFVEP